MNRNLRSGLFGALAFGVVFAAAGLGNYATMPSIPTWYATLNKPFFNPPNWIFGPVWTILFTLLAISLWRILRSDQTNPVRSQAIKAFAAQMILNPAWSIVFFYFHRPDYALIVVIMLEISVLVMIRFFSRIDRIAGGLQWPYAAWVAFAAFLNAAIFVLN